MPRSSLVTAIWRFSSFCLSYRSVVVTVPMVFSADETCDVGKETGSPVSPDYGPSDNEFSGQVNWVQIDLETDDHDHTISPEECFKIAMARQ
jgi:arylsulfatase